MENWKTFTSSVGVAGYPKVPRVPYFCFYQDIAYSLWRESPTGYEQQVAHLEVLPDKETELDDVCEYGLKLGTDTWPIVLAQLKHRGLLVKVEKGWKVCGQVFHYMKYMEGKYRKDEEFKKLLVEAAIAEEK
jgi:hypothetical protein